MIFPHEETMPGPKADRLQLMEATGMNLSPIFALYPDPEGEVQASLEEAIAGQIPIEAADHLGVASRLWPVSGQRAVSRVAGLMGPRPLFVADGHHRYETALAYRDRLTAAGKLRGDTDPANFMLMMLVRISDPGLVILPTHRLVSGLPGLRAEQLREQLGPDFQWEDVGTGPESAEAAWEMMQADGAQELLGFGTAADGHWQLARLGSADAMEALAPAHSPAWRSLGVSILHELVLGRCLAPRFATPPTIRYVHSIDEVQLATAHSTLRTQDSGLSTDLACLVQRAMLEHLQQIASGLEKMPAKSTYFYPKLLSGLVFNPLR